MKRWELGELSRYSEGLWAGRPQFKFLQEQDTFFSAASNTALVAPQTYIQWQPEAVYPGIKRPGRETDHSSQFSAKVKNGGAIPLLPDTPSWRGT
jgi:hypothetical protein